ncbi:uncharacterized protein LOC127564423 [Antechinus flavipes]|uniref:uncharacterized protein LOC127564423 n=1 Tax=Antechinus flavipes TaxID=38775 RepID=UPI002235906A|nr:uncharacterized protein LOC127564423 [Antechinus flavipes]
MKLQNDFPGKSLPLSQNQLPSTKSEKIPTIKGEAVVGIGPIIDYKVGIQLEKPVPQKECSKDVKLQSDFPGKLLPLSQNKLPSTKFEKIPTIKGEAVVGIGPVIDYKVGVQLEKPVSQKECSTDVKLQSDFPGKSLPLSQNKLPSTKVEKIPSIKGEAVLGIGPIINYKVGIQLEKPVPQKECSKDMKLQNDFPGKSLPLSQNQLPSTKSEKIPTIKGEAVVGIGPIIDYKVGIQLEKPVPQKECSKDVKLQSDFPGKSLPLSQNQLPSTKVEKIPSIKDEAVLGIGPVTDYKVGIQLEKLVPQKECSKGIKLQSNYPGKSLPLSQNQLASTRFGKIPPKEGEAVVGTEPIIDRKIGIQLEKSVPQKECSKDMKLQSDSPGKSLPLSQNQSPSPKSGNIPSQEYEVAAAGSEPVIDSKEGDNLEKPVPQKQCEPFLDKEEQKEVKKGGREKAKASTE